MMQRLQTAFLEDVAREFPSDFLLRDDHERRAYGTDWTRASNANPCAVALPRSTDEVARIVCLCRKHCVPIVPSGGRTGLAGGAVAAEGEMVVNLERMRGLGDVDTTARTVRVQAGSVTQAVHEHCEVHGLTWPIDLASKGSSQIGGNLATNAGGLRVIRYGHARHWVLGLQVVTARGDVLNLGGALEKNNTGLDLRQMFIGSEGTLGIITEATLKLERLPDLSRLSVLFFAVDSFDTALDLLGRSRRHGPFTINSFEYMSQNCIEVVERVRGVVRPTEQSAAGYVLLEIERAEQDDDALIEWLERVIELPGVVDGIMSQDSEQRHQLWAFRESITESLAHSGRVHKNDISVPVAQLSPFTAALQNLLYKSAGGLQLYVFGHLGDGNLHINWLKPSSMADDTFAKRCRDLDHDVFSLVQQHRGSISAEHGIGLVKKPFLHFSRSAEEIDVLRMVKRALDPDGLMNPGKIFDL